MPTNNQQHLLKSGTSFASLQEELRQIDFETFEIEDLLTDQPNMLLPSCSSCNTCFTTSCCSSSCSTNS